MKATGVVRPIDNLGRIVLPIELRRIMNLNEKDLLEIFVEENRIVLEKYQRSCIFCGSNENVIEYRDKTVCKDCIKQLEKN
ncbi:MAG: AbrB/MazE/SpoVT family DNA-binding domain-containing protein [Clostridia bacterium]|nr:AbrB/MazE/SpoVT family DNA-binding domain-containing protein [Clostridia bacterium]